MRVSSEQQISKGILRYRGEHSSLHIFNKTFTFDILYELWYGTNIIRKQELARGQLKQTADFTDWFHAILGKIL